MKHIRAASLQQRFTVLYQAASIVVIRSKFQIKDILFKSLPGMGILMESMNGIFTTNVVVKSLYMLILFRSKGALY